jgi:hypothetical protein
MYIDQGWRDNWRIERAGTGDIFVGRAILAKKRD